MFNRNRSSIIIAPLHIVLGTIRRFDSTRDASILENLPRQISNLDLNSENINQLLEVIFFDRNRFSDNSKKLFDALLRCDPKQLKSLFKQPILLGMLTNQCHSNLLKEFFDLLMKLHKTPKYGFSSTDFEEILLEPKILELLKAAPIKKKTILIANYKDMLNLGYQHKVLSKEAAKKLHRTLKDISGIPNKRHQLAVDERKEIKTHRQSSLTPSAQIASPLSKTLVIKPSIANKPLKINEQKNSPASTDCLSETIVITPKILSENKSTSTACIQRDLPHDKTSISQKEAAPSYREFTFSVEQTLLSTPPTTSSKASPLDQFSTLSHSYKSSIFTDAFWEDYDIGKKNLAIKRANTTDVKSDKTVAGDIQTLTTQLAQDSLPPTTQSAMHFRRK